jgi:hypothetical protein
MGSAIMWATVFLGKRILYEASCLAVEESVLGRRGHCPAWRSKTADIVVCISGEVTIAGWCLSGAVGRHGDDGEKLDEENVSRVRLSEKSWTMALALALGVSRAAS